jgi:hypothetical protein
MATPMLARCPARERGPGPDLSLVTCREAGCRHLECRRADAARDRLTRPGTARRLQALAYMGHSAPALAARLGVAEHIVRQAQRGMLYPLPAWLASAVSAAYDDLWDVWGGSAWSYHMARRRGFAPPLAWDDDNDHGHGIDDASAGPAEWKPRRRASASRPLGCSVPRSAVAS